MVSSSSILRWVVCTVLPSLSPCFIHGNALQREESHVLYRIGEHRGQTATFKLTLGDSGYRLFIMPTARYNTV